MQQSFRSPRWFDARVAVALAFILGVISILPSVHLVAARRVSGRVIDADTQAPIEAARVLLVAEDGGEPQMAMTGGDGRFAFDGVAPGRYRAQAMKSGLLTVANVSVDASVIVSGDTPATTKDRGLRRGGVVKGRVVSKDGAPLPELFVQLEPAAATAASVFTRPEQTNERGEFELSGVTPGQFVLVARPRPALAGESGAAAGHLATYFPAATDRERASLVTVRGGDTTGPLTLVMQRGALFTVTGYIIDEDGRAIPDMTLTLVPAAGAGSAVVARGTPNGRFTIGGVQPGSYKLMTSRDTRDDSPPANGNGPSAPPAAPPAASTAGQATATGIIINVEDENLSGVTIILGARPRLAEPH